MAMRCHIRKILLGWVVCLVGHRRARGGVSPLSLSGMLYFLCDLGILKVCGECGPRLIM